MACFGGQMVSLPGVNTRTTNYKRSKNAHAKAWYLGTLDDSFTLNVDLGPTILGAAGLNSPKEMQGRDIGGLYLKRPKPIEPWRSEYYYEFPEINAKIPPSIALVRKNGSMSVGPNKSRSSSLT